MTCFLTDNSFSRPAFQLVLRLGEFKDWCAWVPQEEADVRAKELSALHPDKRVTLESMARVKAVYSNGQRTEVNNYNKFYFLTDEELKATYIRDSVTGELI